MGVLDRVTKAWGKGRLPQRDVILNRSNIYIFPSRRGIAFIALLLLMLVTAINYQSSLVYLYTFLLGGVFFISMWACFFNLNQLEIRGQDSSGQYAPSKALHHIQLRNPQRRVLALSFFCDAGEEKEETEVALENGEYCDVYLHNPVRRRGAHKIPRVGIRTYYPFGLIKAWTWVYLEAETVLFPEPIDPIDVQRQAYADEDSGTFKDSEPDASLKNYAPGDGLSRVNWKRFASKDELTVKTERSVNERDDWLDWDDYAPHDVESRLSYLCFKVLKAANDSKPFGLRLPGTLIDPGVGGAHRDKCLEALARFQG